MSQVPQQGFVPEKVQEFNRRASQEISDVQQKVVLRNQNHSQENTPKKELTASGEKQKNNEKEAKLEPQKSKHEATNYSPAHRQSLEIKNPFSSHYHRSSRAHGHFEMGPRGLDYSPHRMGLEFSPSRIRDLGAQRSTSIHGHELTDGMMKGPEYFGHRNPHFGSQIVPGGINAAHPDVVFRHDYYGHIGFSPPRTSRFSSQEYLNAPGQYGRWPDYRTEYRQRRRSSQDLHSIGQSAESGDCFEIMNICRGRRVRGGLRGAKGKENRVKLGQRRVARQGATHDRSHSWVQWRNVCISTSANDFRGYGLGL
ncbi:hypothetical protein EVAR_3987_1 [Eumeta japonica]|uniref:Uncharacterized protein n=1 Tax=Eumeta variegata TaxID=151549 RepID=A0A4C1SRY0_EUMVA|nr:hypothetical protein EVAR_3987_1 [Eumeta japonica]